MTQRFWYNYNKLISVLYAGNSTLRTILGFNTTNI